MMNGLSIRELQEATAGRLTLATLPPVGGSSEPLGRIVARLDDVRPGDVYWDVVGARAGGSTEAEAAFARGAQGVVFAGAHAEPWAGRFSLAVDDPREALLRLVAAARRRFTAPVVAVVGRVGKSTTLHLIRTALQHAAAVGDDDQASAPWDVRLTRLADSLVGPSVPLLVEIGDEPGREWDEQLRQLAPDIVVVTSLPDDESVDGTSLAGLSTATRRLIDALDRLPSERFVVVNGEDETLRRAAEYSTARTVTVGRNSHCDLMASDVRCRDGWLDCQVEGRTLAAPLWGRHQVGSLLAAYAVGRLVRRRLPDLLAALRTARPLAQRCEVIRTPRWTVIDDAADDRAATMRPALELLRDMPAAGRKIVVCGPLDESPGDGDPVPRLGAEIVARCGADWLVAWGARAPELAHAACDAGLPAGRAVCCRNVLDGQTRLESLLHDGDVVLVKGGSESMRRLVAQLVARPDSNTVEAPVEAPSSARGLRESRAALPPG